MNKGRSRKALVNKRCLAPFGRTVLFTVSFVAIAVVSTRAADPSTTNGSRISPNQSVSIEMGKPKASSELSSDQSPGADAGSAEAEKATPSAPTELVAGPAPAPSRTDYLQRRTGESRLPRDSTRLERSTFSPEAVPWYRSGLGSLGIVLAIILIVVWAVRRCMPNLRGGGISALRVVGRVGLSPKHSVALISVGRRVVLVGMSGDRLTRICEVTDPEEVAELVPTAGASRSGTREFETLLAREVDEYGKGPQLAETPPTTARGRNGLSIREPLNALLGRLRILQTK